MLAAMRRTSSRVSKIGSRATAGLILEIDVRERFPLPWTVEDNGACFIVKDSVGTAAGHSYIKRKASLKASSPRLVIR